MKKFFIDAHCDTITKLMDENKELMKNDCHIDIEKMQFYDYPVQIFAIWLNKKYYNNAFNKTVEYINFYNLQIEKYNKFISKVTTSDDIEQNRKNNKISSILSIEGGEALEGKLTSIDDLYNLGVRAMGLTWNNDNDIAGGSWGNSGITDFGYEVIKKLNQLGIIADVSHLSKKSFWEFNSSTQYPYMASHSNFKALCNNRRNLDDEQMKAIADKNGVIGINLYSGFLSENKISTIEDVINHIDYALKLIGSDYIGFGCDFDGMDKTPEKISDISNLNLIIERLIISYGETITEKLINGNFMRLIKDIL